MKRNSKRIHENFHTATSVQERVIDSKDFTYRHIVSVLDKYVPENSHILDVGCGAGTLCFYLAHKRSKILGIDISDKAIRTCELTKKNFHLEQLVNFRQMNFPYEIPNQQFEFIILTEVLEHLEDDVLALSKLYKLLNKGGLLLLTTPSKNAPLYRLGLADEFDKKVGHVRRYTKFELIDKCEAAGFEIIFVKKNEGIIRNFLFLNHIAGNFIKVINKFNLSDIVTIIDEFSLKLFGESDLIVIARKP